METKFKVGDRVKRNDNWNQGVVGTIVHVDKNQGQKNCHIKWDNRKDSIDGLNHEEYLEKVTERASKARVAKPAKFALQYELDEDPTEYFATLPEVKARIKELSSNSSLKRDKIFLHTLSKTQKVELGTSITIRKA